MIIINEISDIEILTSLDTLIRQNDGIWKSARQANFLMKNSGSLQESQWKELINPYIAKIYPKLSNNNLVLYISDGDNVDVYVIDDYGIKLKISVIIDINTEQIKENSRITFNRSINGITKVDPTNFKIGPMDPKVIEQIDLITEIPNWDEESFLISIKGQLERNRKPLTSGQLNALLRIRKKKGLKANIKVYDLNVAEKDWDIVWSSRNYWANTSDVQDSNHIQELSSYLASLNALPQLKITNKTEKKIFDGDESSLDVDFMRSIRFKLSVYYTGNVYHTKWGTTQTNEAFGYFTLLLKCKIAINKLKKNNSLNKKELAFLHQLRDISEAIQTQNINTSTITVTPTVDIETQIKVSFDNDDANELLKIIKDNNLSKDRIIEFMNKAINNNYLKIIKMLFEERLFLVSDLTDTEKDEFYENIEVALEDKKLKILKILLNYDVDMSFDNDILLQNLVASLYGDTSRKVLSELILELIKDARVNLNVGNNSLLKATVRTINFDLLYTILPDPRLKNPLSIQELINIIPISMIDTNKKDMLNMVMYILKIQKLYTYLDDDRLLHTLKTRLNADIDDERTKTIYNMAISSKNFEVLNRIFNLL